MPVGPALRRRCARTIRGSTPPCAFDSSCSLYLPMPSASQSNENIHVDAGEDRRLTIVAFTGGARLLLLRPYDFMDVTGVMRHNRILVRDPTKSWFHLGFGERGGSFASVTQMIRDQARELKGEKLMAIGTSM